MALLRRLRSAWAPGSAFAARAYSSAPAAAEIPDSWQNPAAVLHGIDDIRFEDVPLPGKVADGHVRVQMRAVGICGSDVHYYKKASRLPSAFTAMSQSSALCATFSRNPLILAQHLGHVQLPVRF